MGERVNRDVVHEWGIFFNQMECSTCTTILTAQRQFNSTVDNFPDRPVICLLEYYVMITVSKQHRDMDFVLHICTKHVTSGVRAIDSALGEMANEWE